MEIRHLLELGKDGKGEPFDVSISFSRLILRPDVILMLENTGPHNTTNAKGEVTLRIWTEDMRDASTVAAVDAHRVVHDKLEDELSAARSLDAVVSKLKLFIDVVNEVAKACPISLTSDGC